MLVLFYFFFLSGTFTVKNIIVPATKNIESGQLEQAVWSYLDQSHFLFFSQRHLALLNKQGLQDQLSTSFPLEKIAVKKQWPSTVVLEFVEKDYVLAWHEDNAYYYINPQGDIVLQTVDKPVAVPVIDNLGDFKKDGQAIKVDQKYLQAILDFGQQFTALCSDLVIAQYVLDNEVNTFKVKLENGPMLYLNTAKDQSEQITKLIALRVEFLSQDDFWNQMYIDLRYGDRVFFQ